MGPSYAASELCTATSGAELRKACPRSDAVQWPAFTGERRMLWEMWKKGFYTWEDATAKYLEACLKSPLLLGPSGLMLANAMKAKAAYDKASASWVGNLGLATKRDQERSLHAL